MSNEYFRKLLEENINKIKLLPPEFSDIPLNQYKIFCDARLNKLITDFNIMQYDYNNFTAFYKNTYLPQCKYIKLLMATHNLFNLVNNINDTI